ncbi:MAG TPA: hypothetical protein PLY93_09585, partial [Turneriella sp.]|nr:hypothetical protein [Turneriella sp.]
MRHRVAALGKFLLSKKIFSFVIVVNFFSCTFYDNADVELPPEIQKRLNERVKRIDKEEFLDDTRFQIGKITILRQTVLDSVDFFAPLVNNLHFTTVHSTISDALNFKEGDIVTRSALYDAERYIRLLDPIKEATILETPNAETGKTDITVVTRDRLSAYVRAGGAGSGGYTSMGVQAGDTSLFGR